MGAIDQALSANAAAGRIPAELPGPPARQLTVVTCMDCRIDPLSALGLALGEAHVLRNAGGVITDDVVRSLAISQRKLGTREVMVIHHSRCGMLGLDADAFEAELTAAAGEEPAWAVGAFPDLDEDVRRSVTQLRGSRFLLHRDAIRGFVLDVDTGRLREVTG